MDTQTNQERDLITINHIETMIMMKIQKTTMVIITLMMSQVTEITNRNIRIGEIEDNKILMRMMKQLNNMVAEDSNTKISGITEETIEMRTLTVSDKNGKTETQLILLLTTHLTSHLKLLILHRNNLMLLDKEDKKDKKR
jgi:hypothetical protein